MNPDNRDTVCDRCFASISSDEANEMPQTSEWHHCTICNDCAVDLEIKPE